MKQTFLHLFVHLLVMHWHLDDTLATDVFSSRRESSQFLRVRRDLCSGPEFEVIEPADRCRPSPAECAILCPAGQTCADQCTYCHGPIGCQDINECISSPCVHGRCVNGNNRYTCVCDAGWTGTNCNTDIDECMSRPCQNGATCINLLNKYKCVCAEDFTSVNCEIDMCIPPHTNGSDVVFVLDFSSSEGSPQTSRMKQYVKMFVSEFPIGPTDFQVSVVSYSFDGTIHFYLNTHSDTVSLQQAVTRIDNTATGSSNLAAALQLVREDVLTPGNGASRSVQRYVIILADGLSSDEAATLNQSRQLKQDGVEIISVAIGEQVSHSELLKVASGNDMVFTATNKDAINTILKRHVYPDCPDCFRNTTDIAILVDTSIGVNRQTFVGQMKALRTFLRAVPFHPNGVRASFTRFSRSIHEEFSLGQHFSAPALINAITSAYRSPLAAGVANLTKILDYLVDNAFDSTKGSRANARKLGLIFTQGSNSVLESAFKPPKGLTDNGIAVAAVGIGQDANLMSLLAIASDPAYVYVIGDDMYTSTDVLQYLIGSLDHDVCEMD